MSEENKFKGFQKLVGSEPLSRDEFIETFKELIAFVGEVKQNNIDELSQMKEALTQASQAVKNGASFDLQKLKDSVNGLFDNRTSEMRIELDKRLKQLDEKFMEIVNNKDSDEESMLERLMDRIEFPEEKDLEKELPKMGTVVRDSLESLEGEERLDASAIKGLDKLIKDGVGPHVKDLGSTTNYQFQYFADDETPVGLVNGSNTEFEIQGIPNPATSLKVYQNGQRMKLTEDYTFSGKTITFVNAPLTNSIITVDYRI